MSELRREDGFTLIELVIVVVVLGILTAIAIPSYTAIQDHALRSVAKQRATSSLAQLREKAELAGGDGSYVGSDDRYLYLPDYDSNGKTLRSYAVTFNVYGLATYNKWVPCAGTTTYNADKSVRETVVVGDPMCKQLWKTDTWAGGVS